MTNKKNHDQIKSEKTNITHTDELKINEPAAPNDTAEKTPSTNSAAEKKQGKHGGKLGAIAIVLVVLFGGGLTYHIQQKNAQYQTQIDTLTAQFEKTQSSLLGDLAATEQAMITKVNEVTHHAETVLTQQQKSIESLQLAIADIKGRRPNDWLLAEADYLVKLAGRKLFLEHDAESATLLMESADQRIAALNDPSLVSLRKSMANDITELKSIPIVDRDGLVLRLSALQQQVDNLPLANAILPESQQEQPQMVSQNINDWQSNLKVSLQDFAENFITFRTRDGDIAPLLSPQQNFYLRENMKSKLETAIKAVYTEQQDIYTTALGTVDTWAQSFYDQNSNAVKEFEKDLAMLSKQDIQVDYPIKLDTQQMLSDVIRERLRRDITPLATEEK